MELSHRAGKYVEAAASLLRGAAASFRRKEEHDLQEFAFLQVAGERIEEDLERSRQAFRRRAKACAIAFGGAFCLLSLLSLWPQRLEEELQRPAYGESDSRVEVVLTLDSRGRRVKQRVALDVPAQDLTRAEAERLLDSCSEWLTQLLRERDGTPLIASSDLDLPLAYGGGAVRISWESEDPLRLDEEGHIDAVGLVLPQRIGLRALLQAGEYSRTVDLPVILPADDPAAIDLSLQREATRLQARVAEEPLPDRLVLPAQSGFGADADWSLAKEGLPWEIVFLGGMCCLGLLFARTDPLKNRLKRQKTALEWDIPDLSLQLMLFLNAGLTVDAAFERVVQENRDRGRPLYAALEALRQGAKETNASFAAQFFSFAQASGQRDLIRLASLVLDCSGRGSELAGKLDRERAQLQSARMNAAKARARRAETKLCLPLMGMLLVMVIIAIAPALMEI